MATTTTLTGTVAKTNGSGFQIAEQDGWLNISKYAKNGDANMPQVGAKVSLTLDGSGFVRKIEPLQAVAVQPQPQTAPEARTQPVAHTADQKDLRITRLACVNSAIALLYGTGGRGYTDEMLEVAAKLEGWVLR